MFEDAGQRPLLTLRAAGEVTSSLTLRAAGEVTSSLTLRATREDFPVCNIWNANAILHLSKSNGRREIEIGELMRAQEVYRSPPEGR